MASILIVDDDRTAAEQVARTLKHAGHRCAYEPRGDTVAERCRAETFNLLILDIMLPGTSGFEVCRRIRRDPEIFGLPILLLSAMDSDEEVSHGLAQGADDYITKPFDPGALLQRVEALLRLSTDGAAADPLTSLPGAEQTKRELQRRSIAPEGFGMAYFELLGIREFAYRCGHEARCRAIRRLGRALQKLGEHYANECFFVGHMGGGHFVCLLPHEKTSRFCEALEKSWHEHLPKLYESVGEAEALQRSQEEPGTAGVPILQTICCATIREPGAPATSQALFETVSRIRQRAQNRNRPGIYFDQRT